MKALTSNPFRGGFDLLLDTPGIPFSI